MNKYLMLTFLIILTPLFGQESVETEFLSDNTTVLVEEQPSEDLPMGFRSILIGLTMDEAKVEIENDGYFDYRGDPDVSMLLSSEKSIIESSGNFYIEDAYFQFYQQNLYTITLVLDTKEVDYYTMYTTFIKKYGKYSSLSPTRVVWENEKIRISIEKPLTIKYVGLEVYDKIIEADVTQDAIEKQLREDFISEF